MEEDADGEESDCFIEFWTPLMAQLSGWKRGERSTSLATCDGNEEETLLSPTGLTAKKRRQ
jgi:hypothetical protein